MRNRRRLVYVRAGFGDECFGNIYAAITVFEDIRGSEQKLPTPTYWKERATAATPLVMI